VLRARIRIEVQRKSVLRSGRRGRRHRVLFRQAVRCINGMGEGSYLRKGSTTWLPEVISKIKENRNKGHGPSKRVIHLRPVYGMFFDLQMESPTEYWQAKKGRGEKEDEHCGGVYEKVVAGPCRLKGMWIMPQSPAGEGGGNRSGYSGENRGKSRELPWCTLSKTTRKIRQVRGPCKRKFVSINEPSSVIRGGDEKGERGENDEGVDSFGDDRPLDEPSKSERGLVFKNGLPERELPLKRQC